MTISVDTLVLAVSPLRWASVNDLAVGDLLIDEKGERTEVVRASEPLYPDTMYRVQFSTGEEVRVGGSHRWVTWTVDERMALTEGWPEDWAARGTVRSTDEIYSTRDQIHAVGHATPLDHPGWHQIVNIEEVPPEVCRAVSVDGSGLFIVGMSFIPARSRA
jgi:hypothetical protein